jgi:hypothetical protein
MSKGRARDESASAHHPRQMIAIVEAITDYLTVTHQ